jgi:hypothetical protein
VSTTKFGFLKNNSADPQWRANYKFQHIKEHLKSPKWRASFKTQLIKEQLSNLKWKVVYKKSTRQIQNEERATTVGQKNTQQTQNEESSRNFDLFIKQRGKPKMENRLQNSVY